MIDQGNGNLKGPVVIGGLGGSGTRLFAALLQEMQFQFGEDQNGSLDNLEFTFLFKRRDWLLRELKNDRKGIDKGLSILKKSITGCECFTFSELAFIATAALTIPGQNNTAGQSGNLWLWSARRLGNILRRRKREILGSPGWAWKEPNSHVILPEIHSRFPDVQYIHVIRHGLDMAFSRNQSQLQNWGELFGVPVPLESQIAPELAVDFWLRANQRAIDYGRTMPPGQFLLVNYDEFCSDPESGLEKLLQFIRVEVSDDIREKLLSHCRPSSIGRHSQHDLSMFDESQLQAVKQFGFKIWPAESRVA